MLLGDARLRHLLTLLPTLPLLSLAASASASAVAVAVAAELRLPLPYILSDTFLSLFSVLWLD